MIFELRKEAQVLRYQELRLAGEWIVPSSASKPRESYNMAAGNSS